jgi:hypothetical protein
MAALTVKLARDGVLHLPELAAFNGSMSAELCDLLEVEFRDFRAN